VKKYKSVLHSTKMEAVEERSIGRLIHQIVNVAEGDRCFLCKTSGGNECVWDDIGDEIIVAGNNAMLWHDDTEPSDVNTRHKVARFACYRHYVLVVNSWVYGQGRIRIPECVEMHIRGRFPGNGHFVGFHPRNLVRRNIRQLVRVLAFGSYQLDMLLLCLD